VFDVIAPIYDEVKMNSVRYTYFIILVLVFSWPVLLQSSFSPWFIWLYPFVIWLIIMVVALLFERTTKCETNNKARN